MSNLAQSYITLVIGGELPIAQGNYDMKNSVTAVYMKALAEKNLGELRLTIFPTITLKLLAKGGEQIENVKETAKNCLKK